ncbi:hypothetical protein WH221_05865 [Chryseobacterium culicis]|uniref:Uncharacterized protein n=1 Tax=Chryseobacterium culicis TaxID=680127 RepID=A0A2S9CZ31_CHRCI|nr:hypothetical protein [Chryseobacterium culicis]PRB85773.1 hypothetical protein CQ022_05825 [Chryseobacterium culicis]PRB90503.1 hypothetical protein CQ033_07160 [Chryseobacterium culicis]
MKYLILLLLFFSLQYKGQLPYIDPIGFVERIFEKNATNNYEKSTKKSLDELAQIEAVNEFENLARTTISTKNLINFARYSNVCNPYLNPVKKSKCKKKLEYIKAANSILEEAFIAGVGIKVNRGNREKLDEGFMSTINFLTKELDEMKYEAEQSNLFYRLGFVPK